MMKLTDAHQPDPMVQSFLRYIETATREETERIMKKYQEQMNKDLEAVREKIVAQASIRLSNMMSIQDLGTTIRIEITKDKQ